MNPNVSAFLDKAHRALDAARLLADASDAAGAINRAYYAAFYAARAALLTVGETPKTHAGTPNRFRVRFVDTGQISAALGKVLYQIWMKPCGLRRLKSAATHLKIKDVAASFSLRFSTTNQPDLVLPLAFDLRLGAD